MYGRFLSPDPARDQHFEETQSWNIYSYVRNMPTILTDPTGMVASGGNSSSMPIDSENGGGFWFTSVSPASSGLTSGIHPAPDANNPTSSGAQSAQSGTQPYSGGINPAGFSLSGMAGQVIASDRGLFVMGADLASTGFVAANAQGNVSLNDVANLPGAQFQTSAANMPASQSFVSTKVAGDFYNTASAYHSEFSGSDKLMVNSANRNDGALFGSHTNSHTGAKPAIDVAYQDSSGRNLSGHTAAGLADVSRAQSLLSIGARNGFTRSVTAIEGIGSFQVRQDHDNHIHLGE